MAIRFTDGLTPPITGERKIKRSTINKLETIAAKMEDVTKDMAEREIVHKIVQLKSRWLDILREAERFLK